MLRLAFPRWRTLEDLQSEALWLNALSQDTSIAVPNIIPTRSGDDVLSITVPDIPDIWHITLMRWIPGRLLGHYLSRKNLKKMGRLFAELHHHGATWSPPNRFTKRRFKSWLSRGEPDLISELVNSIHETSRDHPQPPFSSQDLDLLRRIMQHIESSYQALPPSDLRVIYCDLWHDNIKLHHESLYPFDFEDTIWGWGTGHMILPWRCWACWRRR